MSVAKVASAAAGLSDTAKNILVGGVVLAGGYLVYKTVSSVTGAVSAAGEALNLKDTAEEKAATSDIIKFEKTTYFKLAFSPDPWKGKTATLRLIGGAKARAYAANIYVAFRSNLLNDDEERIYGVYRQLPTKADMALMATAYWYDYKKDLYTELKTRLNQTELNEVLKIVKSKKDFIKK